MCATIVQSGEHASEAVSTWGGALPLSLAVLRPPAFTPRQVLDNVAPFFSLHRRPLGRAGDRATRHTGSVPMPWGMPGPDVWIRQDKRVTVNQAVAGARQGAPYAVSTTTQPQGSGAETRLPMLATLAPFMHVHIVQSPATRSHSPAGQPPLMGRMPRFTSALLPMMRSIQTGRTRQSAKHVVLPIQLVAPLTNRSLGPTTSNEASREPTASQRLAHTTAMDIAISHAGQTAAAQSGSAGQLQTTAGMPQDVRKRTVIAFTSAHLGGTGSIGQSHATVGIQQRVQPRSVMAATTAHLDQVATFAGQPAASARQPALHAQSSISGNPEVEPQLVWRSGAAQPGIGAPSLAGSLAARHGERPAPNGWVGQIYRRITDMNSEPGPYATLPQAQLVKTEQLIERIVKREVTAEVARQQQKVQRQLEGQANDPPIGHLKPSAAPTIAALTRDEVVKALLAKMRDALQDERFRRGLLR